MKKNFQVNSLVALPVLFPELLFLCFAAAPGSFSSDGFFQLLLFLFVKSAAVLILVERVRYHVRQGWTAAAGIWGKGGRVIRIGWSTIFLLALPTGVLLGVIAVKWGWYQEFSLLFYQMNLAVEALLLAFIWIRGVRAAARQAPPLSQKK